MNEREYLIAMRNERGLTQKDVSRGLGISESYYNLIEHGSRQKNMSFSILLGLSKVMNVSVEVLMNKEKNICKRVSKRMKFPTKKEIGGFKMIGKTVNGYSFVGNINNRVVLAHNPKAAESWVVWWLDSDGDPYSGSYFTSRDAAINEFCSRAF